MFSHNMIPAINEPSRVAIDTAAAIDHLITKTVVDTQFKSEIMQTDFRLIRLFSYDICPPDKRKHDWKTKSAFCL